MVVVASSRPGGAPVVPWEDALIPSSMFTRDGRVVPSHPRCASPSLANTLRDEEISTCLARPSTATRSSSAAAGVARPRSATGASRIRPTGVWSNAPSATECGASRARTSISCRERCPRSSKWPGQGLPPSRPIRSHVPRTPCAGTRRSIGPSAANAIRGTASDASTMGPPGPWRWLCSPISANFNWTMPRPIPMTSSAAAATGRPSPAPTPPARTRTRSASPPSDVAAAILIGTVVWSVRPPPTRLTLKDVKRSKASELLRSMRYSKTAWNGVCRRTKRAILWKTARSERCSAGKVVPAGKFKTRFRAPLCIAYRCR
mmetsp:Transcript_7407/g.20565  ORF Transcript_7407/g.20565 Transcript_7407/m.20565 type:complete len:318 (-) Transcript_7407:64-1017(-)